MRSSYRSLVGRLRRPLRQLRASESGQGLVEYALIIAIVSLGAIASLTFLKGSIAGLFSKAGSSISTVAVGAGGGGGGDTTAPVVTITLPADGANNVDRKSDFGGACGTLSGDAATISLTVTRTSGGGSPSVFVNNVSVTCTAGNWTYNPPSDMEKDRDYSATATQSDSASNVGSATITFHTKD